MPVKKPPRVPKLRTHKATGQGYVVLNGRAMYLGRAEKPETEQRYHQVIAEWLVNDRQPRIAPGEITVKELIARYWVHAQMYYGQASAELQKIRDVTRPLKQLYAGARITDFGPRALRTVRQKMTEAGLCRRTINDRVGRIRRMWRWAASEEIIPGEVYHALLSVEGLRRGRCEAKESQPVLPVPDAHVEAIQPFVNRHVWAMIELQRLTGARPGEIAIIRPLDVDMKGKIWVYTPSRHKTAVHGHERRVYLGPRAQEVLRLFLHRRVDAYCFSPAEADAERRAALHEQRKTPLSCGNAPGTNRKVDPQRKPGDVYTVGAYRTAIVRACERAGVPEWHPHQLRHAAATLLRREFGLETARVILGHRSAAVTTMYAEADQQKAVEAMARVG